MNEIDEKFALDEVAPNDIKKYNEAAMTYIKAVIGYYSTIELANDKCFLVSYNNIDEKYYYSQFNLITNYLYVVNNILENELNMNFIPLYSGNHSIISPELCTTFLMKQSNDMFDENSWYFRNSLVRANYNNIEKGVFETTKYLELFLRNTLLNENHELNNRYLHIKFNNNSSR